MSRETIFAALFNLVKATPGLASSSRKARPLANVSEPEMPILFQLQAPEIWEQKRGLPPKRILRADLEIYVSSAGDHRGETRPPSAVLNPILDALEAALAPGLADDGAQTLGGLVSHCWIEGGIEIFEGLLEGKTAALVRIHILIP
jgi:hypothetical protein